MIKWEYLTIELTQVKEKDSEVFITVKEWMQK